MAPAQVLQDLPRGILPRNPRNAAPGMRAGAAEIRNLDSRSGLLMMGLGNPIKQMGSGCALMLFCGRGSIWVRAWAHQIMERVEAE